MKAFTYIRPETVEQALKAYTSGSDARFIAGGTNLLDLMKMGVQRPTHLVDINRLPLKEIVEVDGGVRVGALVSNTELANHPLIRKRYPLISEATLAGASQQLRNMATLGGNLLQKTRCYYFYDPSYAQCNKRSPGSGCSAIPGVNRIHAILGASEQCIATHPSDLCVALSALDAKVNITGPKGNRTIAFLDFHRLPGNTPNKDTNLNDGELILSIELPKAEEHQGSHYLKIRDRQSYAFALVSVAATLTLQPDGIVGRARIALGGVAHKPWRATVAEKLLTGHKLEMERLRAAAEGELQKAKAQTGNAFKIELAKRAIVRAVSSAAEAARNQAHA